MICNLRLNLSPYLSRNNIIFSQPSRYLRFCAFSIKLTPEIQIKTVANIFTRGFAYLEYCL